jgi:hypothetical protein
MARKFRGPNEGAPFALALCLVLAGATAPALAAEKPVVSASNAGRWDQPCHLPKALIIIESAFVVKAYGAPLRKSVGVKPYLRRNVRLK